MTRRKKKAELARTEEQISAPDFWSQPEKSQKVMQERKRLEEAIENDTKVAGLTDDLDTLFELAREGEAVSSDIERDLKSYAEVLGKLETGMLLSGENDRRDAIVTIHPGAGGTESQDWAEMLMRMYLRWAERNGYGAIITDRLEGEGAGIKSATFEVNGPNAYGMLQSEIGVHRLVRISPFDANARRHTSFASVFVYPQIDEEIKIDIKQDDLRIDTFRSGGAGGQHVNMTDSAVRITHFPTGHRGAVPERALAAQEPRQRDEAVARAALRVRAGEETGGIAQDRRFEAARSTSAARFAVTCWRPTV